MAVAAKLVAVVCILVPAEYLTDALAHHLHVSVMDEFLFAGIGNELPDLPGQRVMHVADQHKTTIGRDVRRVEIKPLEEMSGESKSTRIFLSETISGREKSIFSWWIEDFEVPLHIRSVFITLIFSTIKVLIFADMAKKNASFLCPYELFRLM